MEPASQARTPGRQRGVAWEDDEVRAAELRAARPSAPPQRPLPGAYPVLGTSSQAQAATAARRERAQEADGAQMAGPGASDAASGAKPGPQPRSGGAEAVGRGAAGKAGGAEGARAGSTAGPAGSAAPGLVLTRELLEARGREAARQRARAGGSGVLPPGFPAAAPDDTASVYSLRAHPLALASLAASSYAASTRAPSEAGSVGGMSTWCVGGAAPCRNKCAAMRRG